MGWFADAKEDRSKDRLLASVVGGTTLNVETIEVHEHTIRHTKGYARERKPYDGISLTLENGEELQSRITATRLVALGIFALAAKKKRGGEKFLTVQGPDFLWSVEIPAKQANKAMKVIAEAKKRIMAESPNNEQQNTGESDSDITKKLESLGELHDQGILTDEEFAEGKKKILGI